MQNQNQATETIQLPQYEPPRVKFMDEQEMFEALQVSVNAASWWASM
jgi:hypothetical protein